jgi:hypothetical protein
MLCDGETLNDFLLSTMKVAPVSAPVPRQNLIRSKIAISLFHVANRLNTVREGNQECLRRVARSLAQLPYIKDASIPPSFRRTLS